MLKVFDAWFILQCVKRIQLLVCHLKVKQTIFQYPADLMEKVQEGRSLERVCVQTGH